MNLKEVRKKIIEKNDKEYNDRDENEERLLGEETVRKRLEKLSGYFNDEKNIFSKFPLMKFNEQEQNKILEELFWRIEKGEDREIISKINKCDEKIDLSEWYGEIINKERCIYKKFENRLVIRQNMPVIDLKETKNILIKKLMSISNPLELIKISFDTWVQFVTYRLFTIKEYTEKETEIISDKLINYQYTLLQKLFEKSAHKKNIDININESFKKFSFYLDMRKEEVNYINIMNELVDEIEENPEKYRIVDEKYRVTKKQSIEGLNIEEILCEGKYIFDFEKKLEETKKVISIFSKYGGRKCSVNNIQDLKVYFREIYLNNTKYSKKARRRIVTIIRNYLSQLEAKKISVEQFQSLREYIFVREKITKGYYREINKSQSYILRSRLYESAYKLYSEMILLYDDKEIISLCNKINELIFKKAVALFRY